MAGRFRKTRPRPRELARCEVAADGSTFGDRHIAGLEGEQVFGSGAVFVFTEIGHYFTRDLSRLPVNILPACEKAHSLRHINQICNRAFVPKLETLF